MMRSLAWYSLGLPLYRDFGGVTCSCCLLCFLALDFLGALLLGLEFISGFFLAVDYSRLGVADFFTVDLLLKDLLVIGVHGGDN